MKDAPFGVAGVSDIGLVRISSNPWLVELLHNYVNPRRKVGVLDVCADHGELRHAGPRHHSQGDGGRPCRGTGPVMRIDPPLPARVRTRLWLKRRVDLTATWLVVHVHWRAGKLLWQLCGMW
jgi:hypothetical protein